jgi:hypothetical protein
MVKRLILKETAKESSGDIIIQKEEKQLATKQDVNGKDVEGKVETEGHRETNKTQQILKIPKYNPNE